VLVGVMMMMKMYVMSVTVARSMLVSKMLLVDGDVE